MTENWNPLKVSFKAPSKVSGFHCCCMGAKLEVTKATGFLFNCTLSPKMANNLIRQAEKELSLARFTGTPMLQSR